MVLLASSSVTHGPPKGQPVPFAKSTPTPNLFASFNEEQLNAAGLANNNSIYVMAIGFICVGHANHHIGIIKERYL